MTTGVATPNKITGHVYENELSVVSAEQAYKARMTVWFVIFFLERAFVELALAERADKVLRMVLAIHGSDAAASHRLVTPSTQ